MTLDEIAQGLSDVSLTSADIDLLCERRGQTKRALFDELAYWLAVAFIEGRKDFSFCDGVSNMFLPFSNWELSDFAWDVYLAFDNGEFDHEGDPKGLDTVEKYTRPMLLAAIEGWNK